MSMTNDKSKWWILAGLGLASFLGCIDFTIVNTAIPSIQAEMNVPIYWLQWVMTIFLLALSTSMVIAGRLADMYGHRLLVYIGMALFGLASLGAGTAINIDWLIGFRFLQGIAVAILYVVPITLLGSIFPENERGKATGILIGVNGLGLAIGPMIGGFILSVVSWRWIFLVNVPLILLSFIILIPRLSESRKEAAKTSIDWPGLILLIIGLSSLIIAISQGNIWSLVIALTSLTAFIFVEYNIDNPIVEFHLFSNRIFICSIIANISLAFFYTLAFFLMPLYLHNIRGDMGYQIGLMLLPTTAMVAILSPIVGKIVDKQGPKLLLIIGFSTFACSALLQALFTSDTNIIHIIIAFTLMGIGWACILSPSIIAAMMSVPESSGGVAMGTIGTLHNLGGAVGLAIGTTVYHYAAKDKLISLLTQNKLTLGPWINQVVANPDDAIQLLLQYTNTQYDTAKTLFQHFFLNGYSSAMILLVAISAIALLSVTIGVKK